jgi:arylsulfatase A-like enzyme
MGERPKLQSQRNISPLVHRSNSGDLAIQLRTSVRELSPHLSIVAFAWFIFFICELGFQLFIPGSALRNDQIPIGARFLLVSHSITILTVFLAIAAFLGAIEWLTKRFFPGAVAICTITRGFTIVLTLLTSLLYFASWALFWQTGTFINSQTVFFVAPPPLQVFHWVDLDLALGVIVVALAVTFAITIWIPRWMKRWQLGIRRGFVMIWMAAVALSSLLAYLGALYSGTEERRYLRSAILYVKARDNTSGPFPNAVADVRKHLQYRPKELYKSDDIRIIQRPIIPMDQYLAATGDRPIQRWNVIIIIVESLRSDQLRAYGSRRDIMPTVDDLARESRVFLNAYSHSSHTDYATLTPLSSHYPLRSPRAYTYPKNPTYPRVLIYDVLKALGYHTAIFSSSNEHWGGMSHFLQTGNIDRFFHAANFKGPTYVMQADAGFAEWTRETKHAGSVDDRHTVAEAIQWIDGLKSGPFFIALNFQSSHLPYVVPYDFPRRFGPTKLDFTIRFAHFPRDKIQVVKDVYADSLAYVDSQIARLVHYLKAKNLWDNTVIVLTSDHGQAFYEHGFASHASAIFDEVMKVPLVIRAPRLESGVETRVAQHVDIAPSVLRLLGLPPHPSFQGADLLNTPPDSKRSAYMVAQTPLAYQYGIVRSGFKLIYDEREGRYSLYDLASDPGEQTDIAGSNSTTVNELAKRLRTWRMLQIEYYADTKLQTREYPPIIAD